MVVREFGVASQHKRSYISCQENIVKRNVKNFNVNIVIRLQVAVLAPLALLLVLEARCVHFVIAHFNYFVLWSSASLTPHIHVYMMTNL